MSTLDLTTAGSFGAIGNGLFGTAQTQPAGTGVFNTFLRVQASPTEQGYNTDGALQFDEKNGTHSVLLAQIPIVFGDGSNGTLEGQAYREFRLDLNEPNGGSKNLISLDGLQIWQEESGSLTNFTSGTGFAGTHTNYLAYNLDAGGNNSAALNAGLSHGSGQSDIRVLIPDTAFINDAAHRYVSLYSLFGSSDGGFEEWGLANANGPGVATNAMTIHKFATVPGGTADTVGEVVSYSIFVDNVGNTTLTNLTVTDPAASNFAPVLSGGFNAGDTNHNGQFNAGESWQYTGNHTVTQADLDSNGGGLGFILNTAFAGTTQTGLDAAHLVSAGTSVEVVQSSGVEFAKTPDVTSVDGAGDVINYLITVHNTGTTTLTGPEVTDPAFIASSTPVVDFNAPILGTTPFLIPVLSSSNPDYNIGDTNQNGVQDPGETFVFVNIGDTNQNGILDPGETFQFANIGDINGNGSIDPGETFQYYNVGDTNHNGIEDDGETFQFDVSHVVPQVMSGGFNAGDTNQDGQVSPGETWQYALSYTVTQADIDNGGVVVAHLSHDNTAFLTDDQGKNASASASVTIVQNPHLTITKVASIPDSDGDGKIDSPADDITYTITVVNDGNMTLTGVSANDSIVGSLPFHTDSGAGTHGDNNLNVGETWTYSAFYNTQQSDIDNHGNVDGTADNNIHNTATVTTAQGAGGSASADVPIDYRPHLSVTKAASIPDSDHDGKIDSPADDITSTITVVNDGNVTLTGVSANDSIVGSLTSHTDSGAGTHGDASLDVGETWTYTAVYDTQQADIDNHGNIDGTADNNIHNTAAVTTAQGAGGSASADVAIDYHPHLIVAKMASIPDSDSDGKIDSPADDITYTVTVVNDGNVTLTGVSVNDSIVGSLTSHTDSGAGTHGDASLDVGETWTYTAVYDTQQADIDNHGNIDGTADNNIHNTATVTTAQGAGGSASADVPIDYRPAMTLSMASTGYTDTNGNSTPDAGETLTFSLVETNTGNVTLHNIIDSDLDGRTTFTGTVASLAPGASDSTSVVGTHVISSADLTAGSFEDEAVSNADEPAPSGFSGTVHVDFNTVSPAMAAMGSDQGGASSGTGPVMLPAGSEAAMGISIPMFISGDPGVPSDLSGYDIAAVMNGGFNAGDANHTGYLDGDEAWEFTASQNSVEVASLLVGFNPMGNAIDVNWHWL